MSSIREEPKTRAQKLPTTYGFNTVLSSKRLSMVDLDSLCTSGSESKMSHSSSLHALQPRSTKNIDSSKLFNNAFNDDTDDID
jgi:hypothetical protein